MGDLDFDAMEEQAGRVIVTRLSDFVRAEGVVGGVYIDRCRIKQ